MSEKPALKSIAERYPLLAKRWDEKLNSFLLEDIYVVPRVEKFYWKCTNGLAHSFQTTFKAASASRGHGCSICSGKQVFTGFNDLASKFPHLAIEWSDKNTKKADEVVPGSVSKAWWKCSLKHEWEATIVNRTRLGNSCPVCTNRQVLAGFNDLAFKFPHLVVEWSPQNIKRADEVGPGGGSKAWWKCNLEHEWEAIINNRTGKGHSCPICSGKRVLAGFNDLAFKFPHLMVEWSDKNAKKADEVGSGSGSRAWWKCNLEHEWEAVIDSRTRLGNGCPVCTNRQVLAGFNDLAFKFPHLVVEWSPQNIKRADAVVPGSSSKAWWKCNLEHEWEAVIDSRTGKGYGCPQCSLSQTSKIEIEFFEEFKLLFPDAENGKILTIPWKKNKDMSADIWFTQNDGIKTVIEFDGHHFHDGVLSKKGLAGDMEHDSIKTIALLNAGYTVVRIRSNQLPHLQLSHPNLFQLSHDETKGDIGATVSTILGFLNSK